MRFFSKREDRRKLKRCVLILQGDMAHWFTVVDGQLINSYRENIPSDCMGAVSHCPWIESADPSDPMLVELVLDTTLDEVDRISVEKHGNRLVNDYRKFMTLAHLRKDYPKSNVYALPQGEHANVATLMHPEIPEQWGLWLLMLQEANLIFHRVATGAEIAAYWSRQFRECKLLVMRVANYERHMLVKNGAVLFLRTVMSVSRDNTDEKKILNQNQSVIDQSIGHIDSTVEPQINSISVIRPQFVNVHMVGDAVTHRNRDKESGGEDDVLVLLAMLLGLDIEYESTLKKFNVEIKTSAASVKQLPIYQSDWMKLAVSLRKKITFWFNDNRQTTDHWTLRVSALRWLEALEPSVRHVNGSYRIALVHKVSVVFAVIAVLAASGALVNGVASKRLIHRDDIQQATIRDAESELYTSAVAINSQPMVAADTLFIADALSGVAEFRPEQLLDDVATAVTAVAGVQLDRLSWAQIDRNEPYETLTYALDSIPARAHVEHQARSSAVQIELSGRVTGTSLKEQQQMLEGFVGQLWQVRGALDARVLESPVDDALSSEADAEQLGRYRVSLILGR